jgi:hypothetical protein
MSERFLSIKLLETSYVKEDKEISVSFGSVKNSFTNSFGQDEVKVDRA